MNPENLANVVWVGIIVIGVVFFLRGLRRGALPGIVSLLGLLFGGLVGLFVGKVVSMIGFGLPWPPLFTGLTVGYSITLVIFLACEALGSRVRAIFSDLIDDVLTDRVNRMVYNLGGGFTEAISGMLLIWSTIMIAVVSANTVEAMDGESSLKKGLVAVRDVVITSAGKSREAGGQMVDQAIATAINQVSPLIKIVLVNENSKAMAKVKNYPAVAEIMKSPKIIAMVKDPVVVQAVAQKDVGALLKQPTVLTIISDLSLVSALSSPQTRQDLDELLRDRVVSASEN